MRETINKECVFYRAMRRYSDRQCRYGMPLAVHHSPLIVPLDMMLVEEKCKVQRAECKVSGGQNLRPERLFLNGGRRNLRPERPEHNSQCHQRNNAVQGAAALGERYKREGSITYPRRSVSRRKAGVVERRFDQDMDSATIKCCM